MRTEVTYTDCNGKKVTKVFASPEELVSRLSVEAKGINLKRKATNNTKEKLRLVNAEINLRNIIKHYSPETENRQRKIHPFEIR